MNNLIIVDVDDTLFEDNCKHLVVPDKDNNFDYSAYRSADTFSKCKPITGIINAVKTRMADTQNKIVFVTARGGVDNYDTYVDTFINAGLDVTHEDIIFAGLNRPNDVPTHLLKRPVFEQLLDSQIWNSTTIYDDNKTNLVLYHHLCLDRDIPHVLYHVKDGQLLSLQDW